MKLQDRWLNKGGNHKVVSIHDQEVPDVGRQREMRVNGKRIRIRGRRIKCVSTISWVDPSFLSKNWNFIIPFAALASGPGEIEIKERDEWRKKPAGGGSGFPVCSITKAISITKLAYFRKEGGIAEITRIEDPDKIREITEK